MKNANGYNKSANDMNSGESNQMCGFVKHRSFSSHSERTMRITNLVQIFFLEEENEENEAVRTGKKSKFAQLLRSMWYGKCVNFVNNIK